MKTISDHHLNKIWRWLSWTFIISYVCFFMYVLLVLGGGVNQKLVISEFKRSHNQKCLGSCNLNKAELLEKKPHRHVKNMQTAHRRRLSWIKLSCCEAAVKFKNNTFKKVFLGDFHFFLQESDETRVTRLFPSSAWVNEHFIKFYKTKMNNVTLIYKTFHWISESPWSWEIQGLLLKYREA